MKSLRLSKIGSVGLNGHESEFPGFRIARAHGFYTSDPVDEGEDYLVFEVELDPDWHGSGREVYAWGTYEGAAAQLVEHTEEDRDGARWVRILPQDFLDALAGLVKGGIIGVHCERDRDFGISIAVMNARKIENPVAFLLAVVKKINKSMRTTRRQTVD